jgi:hypothetical protein
LAFVDAQAANFGLDSIECGDTDKGLAGDRGGRGSLDLLDVPPHMAPAEGEVDLAGFRERGIGSVAVDLQRAAEAG